jgi:hypothetical protein
MRILKAILGGLVGGGLGIAVVASINSFAGYNATWLGLVIGLFVGFGVHYIARGTGKLDYICGAVAALLTLTAIVLSNYATATVFNMRTAHLSAPPTSTQGHPTADEPNTSSRPQVERDQIDDGSQRAKPGLPSVPRGPANQFDEVHVAWLSLAAVIAYLLGRSGAPLPVQPTSDANIDP